MPSYLNARLHYKTELNSTVVADKEQGTETIQSFVLGLECTHTAVLQSHSVAGPLVFLNETHYPQLDMLVSTD